MKEKLTELIKQAKYCTEEELAEYLISAGLVLPISKQFVFEVGDTIRIALPKDKKIMTYNGDEIDFDYNAEDV